MKILPNELHRPATIQSHRASGCIAIFTLTLLLTTSAFGQAPGLLWSTNVGATLFAVDTQTNAYANVGGAVIKISAAGVPLQTNTICPLPGVAQRDAAGNYYFGGNFDGTQNFGGITLVGGWTNWPNPGHWTPGYPTHFVAKYDSGGTLQWVNSFGVQAAVQNRLTDVLVDSTGAVYAGHLGVGSPNITRLSNTGAYLWRYPPSSGLPSSANTVKLGGLTASNCIYVAHLDVNLYPKWISTGGDVSNVVPAWGFNGTPLDMTNTKPVIDNLGRVILAGKCYSAEAGCSGQRYLRKYALDGSIAWSVETSSEEQWVLARDNGENIYLGGSNGLLARYNTNGELLWTNNYSKKIINMSVDASDNRFVGFADGSIARIAPENPPQPPQILTDPQGQTLFTGSNITFTASVSGSLPLRYFWQLDGVNIPNATNAVLNLSNLQASQSGNYSLLVTNAGGSITSVPALLRVKAVQFFLGSQMLTSGSYNFITPPTLSVLSAFPSGSIFYTTDGSPPSFASTFYTGPFAVSSSATVRAIGYSADFSQSEEADSVNITLPPTFYLSVTSTPGGTVTLNPSGGVYLSNTVVTVTATPTNGWSFLYWLGDASGANTSANVTMNANKSVQAVFGTTLATTVAGNGQVLLYPAGGIYPYGSVVRLTGVPQPGNYFGVWGNAASGNTNPLYFTVTNPSPTVSSLFAATPAGQSALTVVITGRGQVAVNPRANAYATNQSVTLTATPDAGETFLRWSGDASGTLNPLSVSMNQGRVVVANFTGPFRLRADRPGIEGLSPQGFRFTVVGDPFATYQIFGSTNLTDWTALGSVSNTVAETQFTDPSATNAPKKFYKATQ